MMHSIDFMTSGILDNLLTKTLIKKPCRSSTSQGVIDQLPEIDAPSISILVTLANRPFPTGNLVSQKSLPSFQFLLDWR